MAYTVLARKYRSQTFDDVLGQDPVAQTLKNSIESDKVAHAYLFCGTRGVGKTTIARILAKSLNCLKSDGPTVKPCCKCDSCVAVNAGEDIDVIEIDGASNNGVEEVRRLRENAIYRPARARYKIYIIDEVHMLSNAAFNALLKTLEEPPEHVKFIFATTEPNKVIPTIQSRCQRFDFSNIPISVISDQLKVILKKEKIKFEDDLLLPLAKMANGSMRDALSLLDRLISTGATPLTAELLERYLGCPSSERIHNLLDSIAQSDAAATITGLGDILATGLNEAQLVTALIDAMRDLMVVKSAGADTEILALTPQQQQRAVELAEKFDIAALVYNITALEKLQYTVKNSDCPRALIEASLLRFALDEHFLNIDSLLSRLKGGAPAPHKKKLPEPLKPRTETKIPDIPAPPLPIEKAAHKPPASPSATFEHWPAALEVVGQAMGPGTRTLLASATPTGFSNGTLTLQFPAVAQMHMCQANGKPEQIEKLLSDHFDSPIKLEFTLPRDDPDQSDDQPPRQKSQARQELLNHPAVKTILMELDATVADIRDQ